MVACALSDIFVYLSGFQYGRSAGCQIEENVTIEMQEERKKNDAKNLFEKKKE